MSRIAGVVSGKNTTLSQEGRVRRMLAHMHGAGQWNDHLESLPGASLGFTGLRRINCAAEGNVAAIVDGLFYNRGQLPAGGCEAEILIRLYRQLGFEKALARINGDFAIALYDPGNGTAFLARDRVGMRPLYYAMGKEGLSFASRPLALCSQPELAPRVDPAYAGLFAGSHYRTFDNDPHKSPYLGVAQLPAAHFLKFEKERISLHRYWDLEDQGDLASSEAELAERYRALLMESVACRLKAVENSAFTLSGGMDSSSVLSCAVRASGKKQTAFSSVYKDPTYDESHEITPMLGEKVEKWNTVNIDIPDTFSLIAEMVAIHDEPVATATWLSHYILTQDVQKKGFNALFGGLGGDELNAGEYEYFFFLFAGLRQEGNEDVLRHEIEEWVRHHDHPIFKKNFAVAESGWTKLADMAHNGRCLPDRARIDKYAGAVYADFYDVKSFNPAMDAPFANYLKNRTYQDIYRETAPCCIRAEDRHTVHYGIENILPFFDYRLMEFMFQVPNSYKIRDGITKRLLREAMKGILPEETRTRIKKTGWNAPAHIWFSGTGQGHLRDLVSSQKFRERGIYRPDAVMALLDEHEDIVSQGLMKENHMMFFWQLANLETWLQYLDDFSAGLPQMQREKSHV